MARAKKNPTLRKIVFTGDLTLIRAGELRDALLGELAAGDSVEIDLAKVESVDLSVMQILCAAHQSARRQGKVLHLVNALPESLLRLVDEGGFSGHIGCALDGQVACVWER
jgi:anti-anti-sigma regulatory factor